MIPRTVANRFANVMGVDLHIAQGEIVLLYALACLASQGVTDRLVFKGGTYARMMVTGDAGRLSEDLDFTNAGLPADPESRLQSAFRSSFHGLDFRVVEPYRTAQRNWACGVEYRHQWDDGRFRLEISYRESPFLPALRWTPLKQSYFAALEFDPPGIPSLQREEAIAEKLRAVQQRATERDLYDMIRYGQKGFNQDLVRLLAVAKLWNDHEAFHPDQVLATLSHGRREWPDLERLIGRERRRDWNRLCGEAAKRFSFLRDLTSLETELLQDSRRHAMRRALDLELARYRPSH